MEGYLFKKGRGDSSLGRRNWKQRWFVLDQQELSYYDDFDLNSGLPSGFKGKVNITGCEAYPVNHHDKKNTFVIIPKNDKEILFQAPDPKLMNLWMKEILSAARGEKESVEIDYEEAYSQLGLNIDDNPSSSDVNRAYRKAALKCHPDKGGDLDEFEKIQKAFNNIMAKMEEDEFERQHSTITYDVVLRKEPGEIGLGLVVIEDTTKRVIQIKDLIPGMQVESLSSEAKGSLKPGDILVLIAGVNVRGMPLSRVAQKLNQFRVPVGKTVKLTFERKVPKISLNPENHDDSPVEEKTEEKANDLSVKQTRPTASKARSGSQRLSQAPEPSETKPEQSYQSPPQASPSPRHDVHEEKDEKNEEPTYTGTSDAVLAENDELKTDLFAKMKALEVQRQENQRLEKELESYKRFLKTQSMEQKRLEEQLKLSYLSAKISKEQLAESMSNLLKVSQKVSSGKELRATPEIQKILQKESLSAENVQGDQLKVAQRIAITAALSVDISGITANKWNNESESLSLKLMHFEQKIQSLDLSALSVLASKSESKVASPDEEASTKQAGLGRNRFDSGNSVSTLGLGSASATHQRNTLAKQNSVA